LVRGNRVNPLEQTVDDEQCREEQELVPVLNHIVVPARNHRGEDHARETPFGGGDAGDLAQDVEVPGDPADAAEFSEGLRCHWGRDEYDEAGIRMMR
jgi:hypothetical protein